MKRLLVSTYEDDLLLKKESLLGSLEQNILRYVQDDNSFSFDLTKQILTKENPETILTVKQNQATITLKSLNIDFDITVKRFHLNYSHSQIVITYLLESQEKPLKIEIEMREEDA